MKIFHEKKTQYLGVVEVAKDTYWHAFATRFWEDENKKLKQVDPEISIIPRARIDRDDHTMRFFDPIKPESITKQTQLVKISDFAEMLNMVEKK